MEWRASDVAFDRGVVFVDARVRVLEPGQSRFLGVEEGRVVEGDGGMWGQCGKQVLILRGELCGSPTPVPGGDGNTLKTR